MTLFKAFLILLRGPAEMIGPEYKWKQSILTGAIIFTLISPPLAFVHSLPYQGAIPPEAHILKEDGVFVFGSDRHGLKNYPFIDFKAENGRTYRLQDYLGYNSIWEFNKANPNHQKVYAEGFFLRDGLGRFWPTQVTTIDGKVLLDKDSQNAALMGARYPLGTIFYMYLIAGFLWILSAFNAIKIKKKALQD
ncbi:hypothetical protein P0D75_04110 [Paraburkholderia sediminicola]|uniref:hypothetical protein n=1 Tax=Paraburkholderia sediminicola TaxID=458836 RepID=UPI0038BA6D84